MEKSQRIPLWVSKLYWHLDERVWGAQWYKLPSPMPINPLSSPHCLSHAHSRVFNATAYKTWVLSFLFWSEVVALPSTPGNFTG